MVSSHAFRVGFVTRQLQHADSHVVAQLVGNKSVTTTLKYNRYVVDEKKEREILERGSMATPGHRGGRRENPYLPLVISPSTPTTERPGLSVILGPRPDLSRLSGLPITCPRTREKRGKPRGRGKEGLVSRRSPRGGP